MDVNVLMAGLLFSSVGGGMFLYGKKAGRLIPLLVGMALMVVPFVVTGVKMMSAACGALILLAWLMREK